MANLTRKQFADRRGVNPGTVTKWADKGLIVFDADGNVDVEATEWNLDQRPASYRGGTTHRPVRTVPKFEPDPRERPATGPAPSRPAPPPATGPGEGQDEPLEFDPENPNLPLNQAAARKENHLGLLRRQEYLTKQGKLIDRAEAEAAFFDEARAIRDTWTGWPARVGIEMADVLKVDARTLTQVLATYVQQHLAELGEPTPPEFGQPKDG